jgi:glycerophosphoryl diester phosphodiesterase
MEWRVAIARCLAVIATAAAASACGDGGSAPPNVTVRERIASLAPAANIGHRGTGLTRRGHPFPENSIPSFLAAMDDGADGIELDVELTSDGGLIVMHDDTLDRTTTCTGCVSAFTLAQVRECRLLDGEGAATDLRPPTLPEVFAALPGDALVNVELKAYGAECVTPTTGATDLATTAVAEINDLGVADRVFFSSFDATAAGGVKTADAELYSALLLNVTDTVAWPDGLDTALDLGLDALHPFLTIEPAGVAATLEAGLQVNVWTVNTEMLMNQSLDKGVSSIITDEPALLSQVLAARR